jgi:hypothetical protein
MPRVRGEGPDDPRALNLARISFKLLFQPGGVLVRPLMDELGIKDRTFRAYRQTLDLMREFQDCDGGSLIVVSGRGDERRMFLRPSSGCGMDESHFAVRFAALNYARQTFSFMSDTPIAENIATFCNDYVAQVKNQTYVFNHLFRDGDRKFYYLPWAPKDYRGRGGDVHLIIRALTDNFKLRVTYESRSNDKPRTVLPLTLVMWKSALYLIVQSEDRRRIYMMAVDRISHVEVKHDKFKYPDKAEYDPDRFLDGGFGIFVEPDRHPKEFELLFVANFDLHRQIQERKWHDSQRFETLPDGRMKMTFTVTTDVEVWPWIRSFGDAVQVIKPSI